MVKIIFALLIAFVLPACAMDADTASAKCATAIDGYLRDPSTAEYQFTQRIVVGAGDSWRVILPVRAQNYFGGFITQKFGCLIAGGHVVKVVR